MSSQNNWATLTSHTDPSRYSEMLPHRLNAEQCALRWSVTTSPVLLNPPDILDQDTKSFWIVYHWLQNATKSNNYDVEIPERLGILSTSAGRFRCSSNLQFHPLGVIIRIIVSNSMIWLTILLLRTLIQPLQPNTQSGRHLNGYNHVQDICYRFYPMQHSFTPNVPVQQLLQQEQ